MTNEERQKLREGIAKYYGALKEVRDRTSVIYPPEGYTYSYVQKVLKGERTNAQVLALAAKVLLEYNQRQADLERHAKATLRQALAIS